MVKAKLNKNVKRIAFSDISEYLKTMDIMDANDDVWIVCASHLDTKETRRLNNELGLHKINKAK